MNAKIDDPNKYTRLLLDNPEPYAELDENARIALSILRDRGWKTQRIGMEVGVQISVTTTPIDGGAVTQQQLADWETRYAALRSEVVSLHERNTDLEALRVVMCAERTWMRRRHWLAAAAGCFLCSAMAFFHLSIAMTPVGAACIVAYRFVGYRRAKGVK
jgi:hypothetical protein